MESTAAPNGCYHLLAGKKFDILWNGAPYCYYFIFHENGKIECNQTMFDGQTWEVVNDKQFNCVKKNGKKILWQFNEKTGQTGFRTDKKFHQIRLFKEYVPKN